MNTALQYGIEILGFSADGDAKLLKAMLFNIVDSTVSKWQWFQGSLEAKTFCVLDTVHAGTKLKTRLLKPSGVLPMGKLYFASSGHILS